MKRSPSATAVASQLPRRAEKATLVAALWGVFIWKEFKGAPEGTNRLLTLMFASFIVELTLIVAARVA